MDTSGSERARTHLMIVDDHATFADALGAAIDLEGDFVFVGSAGTVAKAIALAARTAPDVILLDARLPDGDGIDAIPHLRLASPNARIIILTGWADLETMVRAATAGAAGFLPKEASASEILAAARTAHEGGLVLDHPTLDLVLARARSQSPDDPPGTSTEVLTVRESEVLVLMGEGLDPRAIAERLFLSVHTVRSHVKSILGKLKAHSQLEAVVTAVRRGILKSPEARFLTLDLMDSDPPRQTWP